MASRTRFLKQLWEDVINPNMQERWIDNALGASEQNPDAPFADLGRRSSGSGRPGSAPPKRP